MEKQYAITIILGASILFAAISTSFLPLQFASGTLIGNKPANPAGAPAGNMTGGNTTATPSANTTAGPAATPSANPAGAPPKVCSSPTMPKP
jgi:hypothetical protein